MSSYAKDTTVPVERSKGEIERVLIKYGAEKFASGWDKDKAVIMFSMHGRGLKFTIPIPDKGSVPFIDSRGRKRPEHVVLQDYERAQRQVWRAVALIIKAKLESVESGICVFEEEFLSHFITSTGKTVSERMLPDLDKLLVTANNLKLLTD